ncbi:sigma-70 family RNA polymerase sigma factor [Paenibacillus sp. HN-1]|uniref:sigma-70 family RNA polymerase sigma factor n=1 Tax=Paenibacillus TaxID=44249 RepID=UPI001CA922DD|nr:MULTISPECIES: sigma-70 family RNA polymerase sigma factor [Paenibacillus]MBY9082326.1 sigma-70 family RNA polymerase sigma factor [Paenibacillus sp. CGMCC 1.18879]MBY9086310.1 sigma-70 family RNA polymerase sigma factor [Paenibacillus sinensis]
MKLEQRDLSTADAGTEEERFFRQVAEQKRTLYGIAYSYLRNEGDALEMLQEATCRAWIKRSSLKDSSRFVPWIIRILINCCNDELKRRSRVVPSGQETDDSVSTVMTSDRKLDMERALDAVKPKYRQVLVLKYYRDLTIAEIAEILERPEGTVKTWMNKGLKQLREQMRRKGDFR